MSDYKISYTIHPDLARLLTTSGSTGSPKFVRQSYKNVKSNAEAIAQYLGITSADRPITTMPMSYSYGLSIINSHLLKGAAIILTDATLMDRRFWEEFRINKATTFGGVPYRNVEDFARANGLGSQYTNTIGLRTVAIGNLRKQRN